MEQEKQKESSQGTRRDFRNWLLKNKHLSYTEYARLKTDSKNEIYKQYNGK